MMEKYNTYIIIFSWQGAWWTRISSQIYVEKEEISLMGDRVLSLIQELTSVWKKKI